MKKINLIFSLITVMMFFFETAQPQPLVVEGKFSTDTLIHPFSGLNKYYSLKLDGNVILHSDTSLIRIISIDHYSNRYLLFETYPLIAQ